MPESVLLSKSCSQQVQTDHLIITATGHPRDLRGMVEIVGKTPIGFDPQNIPPQTP
ncbi:MAG: DUF2844 domain-containing protein [Leptospirillum sp.]